MVRLFQNMTKFVVCPKRAQGDFVSGCKTNRAESNMCKEQIQNHVYMKKVFILVSMIAMLQAVLAQPETVHAFLAHGSTVNNVYAAFGQPFYEQISSADYEVAYSVAQAQIISNEITDEVCANVDYNKNGFNIPAPHAVGTVINETAYEVHGHDLGYDLMNTLVLTVNPTYEITKNETYAGSFPMGPDGVTPIHEGTNVFNLTTVKGCDSIVTIIATHCPGTVMDADNTTYNTVAVAGYCWTRENLSTTHYAEFTTSGQTQGGEVASMIYSSVTRPDEAANLATYGRLYTWAAATGTIDGTKPYVQGICPCGWHIPTVAEIEALYEIPADDLRSTDLWITPNTNTNASGFTSLPAGFYDPDLYRFEDMGAITYYWSDVNPSAAGSTTALKIPYYCDHIEIVTRPAAAGYSVRCVMDH